MPLDALGDLVITVGADISPVEQQLGDLPGVAQKAAADIDAAFASVGAGSADGLRALDDAIKSTGDAAGEASSPLHAFGQQAHDAGEAAHEGAAGAGEFGSKLLELAGALGLILTLEKVVEMVKEFATEAIEAYAASERFTVAMTQMTGSAEIAEGMLAQLKQAALQIPVALGSLESAAQKLQAFGVETAKIPGVLRAAADAAAATGNSFDTVAQALARVEVSGQVSARQLVQLGVSWQDIAHTMGVSIDEAQERLKKGGQSAEADLDTLLQSVKEKFGGASQAMADTLAGQFQILKNQLDQTLEGIGEAAAPALKQLMSTIGSEMLPALSDLVNGFRGLGQVVGPALAGPIATLVNGLRDIASSAGSLGTILSSITDTFSRLGSAVGITADSLGKLWTFLHDISPLNAIAVSASAAAASFQNLSPAAAAAALAHERLGTVTQALAQQFGQVHVVLNPVLEQYRELQDNLAKAQKNLKDVDGELAQGNASWGQHLAAVNAVHAAHDALYGSATKSGDALNKAAMQAAEMAAESAKTSLQLDHLHGYIVDVANSLKAMPFDFVVDGLKQINDIDASFRLNNTLDQLHGYIVNLAQDLKAFPFDFVKEGLAEIKSGIKETEDETKAFDKALADLGLDGKKSLDQAVQDIGAMNVAIGSGVYSTGQLNDAWATLDNKFKNSVDAQEAILAAMQKQNAPLQLQLQAQENILNAQIKQAQYTDMTGISEAKLAAQLTEVQLRTWAVNQATMGLANAWTELGKGAASAFATFEKGFADAIVAGKGFGAAMDQLFKGLETMLVEVAVKYVLNQLVASLLTATLGWGSLGVASTVSSATMVASMGTAATAMGAAATSMAASAAAIASAVGGSAAAVSGSAAAMAASVTASAGAIVADFTLIAAAVAAVASIIGAIEQAHTNTLLGRIEESTRRTDITAEGILSQGATAAVQLLPHLVDIWGALGPLSNIEDTLTHISTDDDGVLQALQQIASAGIGVTGAGGAPVSVTDNQVMTVLNALGANIIADLDRNSQTAVNDADANAASIVAVLQALDKDIVGALQSLSDTVSKAAGTVSTTVDVSITPLTDVAMDLKGIKGDLDEVVSLLQDMAKATGALLTAIATGSGASSSGAAAAPTTSGTQTTFATTAASVQTPTTPSDVGDQITGMIKHALDGIMPGDLNAAGQRLADMMQVAGLTSSTSPIDLINGYLSSRVTPPAAPTGPSVQTGQALVGPWGSIPATTDQVDQLTKDIQTLGLSARQASDTLTTFIERGSGVEGALADMQAAIAQNARYQFDLTKNYISMHDLTQVTSGAYINLGEFAQSVYGATVDLNKLSAAQADAAYRIANLTAGGNMAYFQEQSDAGLLPGQANYDDMLKRFAALDASAPKLSYNTDPMSATYASAGGTFTDGRFTPRDPTITVNLQAGVVAGAGGMQSLADTVANTIMDKLRRAGMRF